MTGSGADPRVTVANHQSAFELDGDQLQRVADAAREHCREILAQPDAPLARLDAIEVSIIDDSEIARVHEEFMGIPGPTDVITFDHGEILVSAQTADVQRRDHGNALDREIALYVVHGLLHLAGYDDREEGDFKRMAELQEGILDKAWTATGW